MATHFQWYPSTEEVVVPFNARYAFPSQANKSVKVTPRIPPTAGPGTTFSPGNSTIRINLPAQGYMNPRNSTLEFDVRLKGLNAIGDQYRFQNNIQSLFQRVQLFYGATPIEDIPNYNVLVRSLTEWSATNQTSTLDQTSINEGIGGVVQGVDGAGYIPTAGCTGSFAAPANHGATVSATYVQAEAQTAMNLGYLAAQSAGSLVSVRQKYIQGVDVTPATNQISGAAPNDVSTTDYEPLRRYQVQLALGLFNQEKLIPLKWMASQLTIQITLAQPASCIFQRYESATPTTTTYEVTNVNFIPEILEFDASYDAMFLKGLREGGVPIKFSSWHTYTTSIGGNSQVQFQITERARSVKSIFTVQRRAPDILQADSGATYLNSNSTASTSGGTLQTYQYRVGGRYFPATPVQCSTTISSAIPNGGAEAFVELQKAMNTLSDYRLSNGINTLRWAVPYTYLPSGGSDGARTFAWPTNTYNITLNEADYQGGHIIYFDGNGIPVLSPTRGIGASIVGSTQFCAAIDLETSNGVEISGLNAEEQSDITFIAQYNGNQQSSWVLESYVYFDAMIVLRENNVLELIQ